MHPLLVLIGLIVASSFSMIELMRRERVRTVGTMTAMMGVLVIPIMVFVALGIAQHFAT